MRRRVQLVCRIDFRLKIIERDVWALLLAYHVRLLGFIANEIVVGGHRLLGRLLNRLELVGTRWILRLRHLRLL